ncbi:ABC transporter ATP-binding protein [Tritonibacter horizontis]|uniref:Putative siderophore transport system ATP-binding protein YusV n=1 Tax=Tritonibacter horizontis TaxID=1768241 RepID=A0A132C3B1_9RHOB|nr:putative siderophore transport system ATP-binding protein YusV [Tritonibacter horizontis]
MTTVELQAKGLMAGYGAKAILNGVDLNISKGQITGIVGANACGKSTLLRCLSRLLRPSAGQVLLDGRPIRATPSREVARRIGLLPQSPVAPDGITVLDLVSRGRHPHQGIFARWGREDDAAVAAALEATGTDDLVDQTLQDLSGGQRQRVWIAMVLAQQTGILLLDEPTTFLDISHQIDVLDLLIDLNRARGTTIVMVLHDLNLAARCCDRLVAMRSGRIHSFGPPEQVLSTKMVKEVFGLSSRIMQDPISHKPMMLPISKHDVLSDPVR